MRSCILILLLCIAVSYGSRSRRYTNVVRAEKNITNPVVVDNKAYCFHYTWLKDMNNETFNIYINQSCAVKFADYKPKPLCVNPMLVTDNGQEPDINWLMENKYKAVRCPLYDGYTCAKYTYRFDGEVQNITRYCTKITVNEISMESSCITSSSGAHEQEVCACSKMIGNVPCNHAPLLAFSPYIITIILLLPQLLT